MDKLAILLLVVTFGQNSLGDEIKEVRRMVEEQVANVSAELNEMGPSSPTIFGSWELKALKVRVAASVGFSLPFLISAVLVPELELVFESSEVG